MYAYLSVVQLVLFSLGLPLLGLPKSGIIYYAIIALLVLKLRVEQGVLITPLYIDMESYVYDKLCSFILFCAYVFDCTVPSTCHTIVLVVNKC